MPGAKYAITDSILPLVDEELSRRGLCFRTMVNAGDETDDGSDDSFDDEISFVFEDGSVSAIHIQSGPYGCSVNLSHYAADGDLEAVTVGTLRGYGEIPDLVQEAAEKLAAEAADPPSASPLP